MTKRTIENRTGAIRATLEDTGDGVHVTFWERAYRCEPGRPFYRLLATDIIDEPYHYVCDKTLALLWANCATPSYVTQGAK